MTAILDGLLLGAAALAGTAVLVIVGMVAARMYQIEEYEGARLFAWATTRSWMFHRAVVLAAVPPLLAAVIAVVGTGAHDGRLVAAAWLLSASITAALWRWTPPKKNLVLTPRMRRLLAAAAALMVVVLGLLATAVARLPAAMSALAVTVAVLSTGWLAPALLVLANRLMYLVETSIRRRFLRRATAKLARFQPLVVAVAGSYGKTSTKHILAHLLEPYGPTLATPKSFNTLMGVSRTVNDVLEQRHRTFLVEMDAYAPGEIAAICALVRPRHALLTSVGPQHLERFGSMEVLSSALYETAAALPPDGFLVVYVGDEQTERLAERARRDGHPVVGYALEGEAGAVEADVVARDVSVTGRGSSFTWEWAGEGLRHRLTVPLLGRHQVLNVSAALATVHRLGLPLARALDAVSTLVAVEHRLQPVPTGNAITVIDDSYNANPVGVHNGLEVLAELEAGSRILVTPGLVELGAVEEAENRRYGEHAARVCDHVIVVDARPARALRDGLQAGGLPADRVHVVASLAEATAVIGRIAVAGDAVLFANDLPDTYLGAA